MRFVLYFQKQIPGGQMKQFQYLMVLLLSITIVSANSNNKKEEIEKELTEFYRVFESTVKNKDKEGHRALYLYDTAPVVVMPKTPNGPMDYFTNHANGWINYFSRPDMPYELKISEIEFDVFDDRLAISIARFDEYTNNEYSSHGIDVFTYIKTTEGWKFAMLHNTVRLASDSTDYSKPFEFDNKPKDLPEQLQNALNNKDKYGLINLFHSGLGQFFGIKDEFGEFNHFFHTVAGRADYMMRTPATYYYKFSNIKTKIYDQYIAVITLDYNAVINGKDKRSGKKVMFCYATANTGWKISSVYSLLN